MKFPLACLSALLAPLALGEGQPLRDLSPDRPDTTESPITVDAGHWQIEVSFADFSRDRDGAGGHTQSWDFGNTNLKYGLSAQDDLQLIGTPYAFEDAGSPRERVDGVPDFTVRWKHNLWGNDGGETAFALLPFVSLPTGSRLSSGHAEGGLAAPLGWTPPWAEKAGLDFSFMLEGDAVWSDDHHRYDAVLVHTASCGFAIVGPLHGFAEYAGSLSSDGPYEAAANTGLTYAVNANLMLDAGVGFGLTKASPDFVAFAGFTWRI